jgi:hypothetical protein
VIRRICRLSLLLAFLAGTDSCFAAAQQPVGPATLQVRVLDQSGGAIQGVRVVITLPNGSTREALDAGTGLYTLSGLDAGKYGIRAEATNFMPHEGKLTLPQQAEQRVVLRVRGVDEQVFVISTLPPDAAPEFIGGVRVLRGRALDNLPDSEEALRAYLRLLAPLSAGPFGPAISVDGFSSGRLPPKSSIREIRINDDAFSAEYREVGLSRVEILTKPGTEVWQSGVFFNFNDESLNSRNPFSPDRAPFQRRLFGVNLSGPIVRNRLTLSGDFGRSNTFDNAIINATTVDAGFNIQPLNRTLTKPARGTSGTATFNFQISRSHTLVGSFDLSDQKAQNEGVGGFSLESRAYQSFSRTQTLRLTETAMIGERVTNETRFQFIRRRQRDEGDDSRPTIEVPEAFTSGGASVGHSSELGDTYTFNNLTTWSPGNHAVRMGIELRAAIIQSQSTGNRAGTYIFTGRIAPELDGDPVFGPDGDPVLIPITNIESYRRTIQFLQEGMSSARIRELGGQPAQFSIAGEMSSARVRQYETSAFVQDNWRVRHNFLLNLGLRFETQDNVRRELNLAPRASFTWEPSAGTVIRGGSGLFFTRIGERLSLHARLNGIDQKRFVTTDPAILDRFPQTLSADELTSVLPPAVWTLADDIRAPYSLHSSLSFERVLPLKSTLGLTLAHTRGIYSLRARNINAPLPNKARPLISNGGDILQFESNGLSEQRQVIVNTTHNLSDRLVLWSTYTLSDAKSDTDGPFAFPASSYDLRAEYSRSDSIARHTLYTGGWLKIPGGIELTPLVMWRSGLPFNITTGNDTNGDSQFLERPAFATDLSRQSVVQTPYGVFDLDPLPGQSIVPRNSGLGPSFTIVNLRASRYFILSEGRSRADGTPVSGSRLLTVAVQAQNLFNKSNLATPVGNLSSPLFGRPAFAAGDFGLGSNSAGTRRLEMTISISF